MSPLHRPALESIAKVLIDTANSTYKQTGMRICTMMFLYGDGRAPSITPFSVENIRELEEMHQKFIEEARVSQPDAAILVNFVIGKEAIVLPGGFVAVNASAEELLFLTATILTKAYRIAASLKLQREENSFKGEVKFLPCVTNWLREWWSGKKDECQQQTHYPGRANPKWN
jgi:hypothetical protein